MSLRGLGIAVVAVLAAGGGVSGCRPEAEPVPDPLVVSVPFEIDTLDPLARDRVSNFNFAVHFYEPLVSTNADLEVVPRLATHWSNPTPTSWLFHLRQGVRFHGGAPFEAEDVVATFEALRSDPSLELSVYLAPVASVRAVDPATVEVRTHRPVAVLLNKLCSVPIVRREAASRPRGEVADGTGPYRLVSWRKGFSVEVERNEGYWGEKPVVRSARFLLGRSPAESVADVLEGRAQLGPARGRPDEELVRGRDDVRLVRRAGLMTRYLGFDVASGRNPGVDAPENPFRRREARLAVSAAVDRAKLVAALPSFAIPAPQLVPAFIFGFDPAVRDEAADPRRARELLAAAGIPRGVGGRLLVRSLAEDTGEALAAALSPLGIALSVEAVGDVEFFERARREPPALFVTRYACSTGDGSDVLDVALHSADPSRGYGALNFGRVSDPELDRLIEESAGVLEAAERRERLQAAFRRVREEAWVVPLHVDETAWLVTSRIAFRPRPDGYVLAAEIGVR